MANETGGSGDEDRILGIKIHLLFPSAKWLDAALAQSARNLARGKMPCSS
jgi:hypothetical protein